MSAPAKLEAKPAAAGPSDNTRRIAAERGWQYKGPGPRGQFSWVARPGVLRSPLSIDIPATHNPLNISQVLTNIGKNMPGLSSIISNNWLPRTADTWEPVRKALYPVAHGGGTRCGDAVKRRKRRVDGQNPKSRRQGGVNLWGW